MEGSIVECGEGCEPESDGVSGAIVWKLVPETPGSVPEHAQPGFDE